MSTPEALNARIATEYSAFLNKQGQRASVLHLGSAMQQALGVEAGSQWRGIPGRPKVVLHVRDLPDDPRGLRLG